MAVISKAIKKELHISGRDELDNQTWEIFEDKVRGKKLFIFGVGNGAVFYFQKSNKHVLEGIIDNDKVKQGIKAKWFLPKEADDVCGDLCISDISVLRQYHSDEVVVLITGLKSYSDIYDQLETHGIYQKFALLPMEANWRKNHRYELAENREQYVEKCCSAEIEETKIVFCNQNNYSGHGKYITEQLLKMRKDLDIVWFVEDPFTEVPEGVRLVNCHNAKRYIYEMETAKVWVYDYWVPTYITKRPEQIYVQVKHWSSVTLKTFGMDSSIFKNNKVQIDLSIYNGKIMDYIITGSEFDERVCKQGFLFKGEMYRAGSARSDILFHSTELKNQILNRYNIDTKISICLYAPTFREMGASGQLQTGNINLDFEKVKYALETRFGGKWYIFLRLHPYIAAESKKIEKPMYVIDVSNYSDGQELAAISDIVITDYSSIMFEPAYVKKPVFLFALDKEEYVKEEREFLIDYDTLPFPIAESNEELTQKIEDFNFQEYEENVTKFMDKYGVHEDGHASERAAAFISALIDNNKSL